MKHYFISTVFIIWAASPKSSSSSQFHYRNVRGMSCVIILIIVPTTSLQSVLRERVCSLYLWELHKVLPDDAIVIEHNRFYQNIIFSAPDCQRSMMETSVLGFMRFDNIGFATSALAWPHQRALQQLGREGQDCTDGTDGRSFQIRKVTRLQSYKMHTFAHK